MARDIDSRAVRAAKENALEAGVEEYIEITRGDIARFEPEVSKDPAETGGESLWTNAVIVTNLPYGVRIGDDVQIQKIYNALKRRCKTNPGWSVFAITSDKEMEKAMGRKANRRRKLYNGNIETTYYQFHGVKR